MIRKPWGQQLPERGGPGRLGCRQVSRVSREPREWVTNLDLSGLIHQRDEEGGVPGVREEQKHHYKFLQRPGK